MEPILSIRNLTKYKNETNYFIPFFKRRKVILDSIYLNIYPNEIFCLVGETLSGKSSLGKAILRLTSIDTGKIIYKKKDITSYNKKEMKKIREEMQIIFQHSEKFINPKMSIYKLIAEPLNIRKKSVKKIEEMIFNIFEKLDLSKTILNKLPSELTITELEKVMLARVLILNPSFLVADEPTVGLDLKNKIKVISLLKEIKEKSSLTILLISNNIKEILMIADRIGLIYKGQIVEVIKKDIFLTDSLHPYSKIIIQNIKKIEDFSNNTNNIKNKEKLCSFLENCPIAIDRCYKEKPKLKEIQKEHYVSCFRYYD